MPYTGGDLRQGGGMDFHPLAKLFPLIVGEAFKSLCDDIELHGLIHPIVTLDGAILDGRNRFLACQAVEVEPRFEPYTGDNPLAYVIASNLHRRHLTDSQRSMIAARLMSRSAGGRRAVHVTTRQDAAGLLNVTPTMVDQARRIVNHGTIDQIAEVDRGDVKVGHVSTQITKAKAAAKAARVATQTEKEEREAGAIAELTSPDAIAEFVSKLDKLIDQVAAQKVVPLVSIAARVDAVRRFAAALRVSQAVALAQRRA